MIFIFTKMFSHQIFVKYKYYTMTFYLFFHTDLKHTVVR